MRHKLSYLIFAILLAIFLAYVLMPLIRLIHPSLAQLQLSLDPSSVGLAAILVFVSFALILLDKVPPSAVLSRLKLSAQGVEAEFERLEELASQVREGEVIPSVKEDLELILQSDTDPKSAFLELIIEIEKKLKLLVSKSGGESWKYTSVTKIVGQLETSGIIDHNLAKLIRQFWYLRNKTIHGEIVITKDRLEEAIQIGEAILSRLEKAYSN